jgi:hypothetical protein
MRFDGPNFLISGNGFIREANMSDDNEEVEQETSNLWKDTSDKADAINTILSIVNCPSQVSNLIHVLIGISGGRLEFESNQKEISTRMKKKGDDVFDDKAKQGVKRAHQVLRKWQEENNLNLIEYRPGYKDKENRPHYSFYHLHILPIADEVIALARKMEKLAPNRPAALLSAALSLRTSFYPEPVITQRDFTIPRYKEVTRDIKTGIAFLRKALKKMKEEGSFVLINHEVIDELEDLIKMLRDNPVEWMRRKANDDKAEGKDEGKG